MKKTFSSPVVVCRPALPRDTADVLEFTKFTWDNGDYIKYVWDDWFADPNGILATAEYGGHCVGIAKITLSAPGQWWLEGLRVDPKFQGRGIASTLHTYIDAWWLENGDGVARFMTSSERVKVHHLAEKLSYTKTLGYKEIIAPSLEEEINSFSQVKTDDISDATQRVLDAPVLKSGNGLIDLGWDTLQPTEEILISIQGKGNAYWWRDREGLLLSWRLWKNVLGIALPACSLDTLSEFLLDIRRFATQQDCTNVFWIIPLKEEILASAESAGFIHHKEHDIYLYEKQHTLSGTSPIRS